MKRYIRSSEDNIKSIIKNYAKNYSYDFNGEQYVCYRDNLRKRPESLPIEIAVEKVEDSLYSEQEDLKKFGAELTKQDLINDILPKLMKESFVSPDVALSKNPSTGMKSYCIEINNIDNPDSDNLMKFGYENIYGKTPADAIKRRFDVPLHRVSGDDARYADVIISEGAYDEVGNNILNYGRQYCFAKD